jgi:hypothetical protein
LPPLQEISSPVKSVREGNILVDRAREEIKKDLEYILSKVNLEKRTFGPDKYILEMEAEELERMKRKLKAY